MLLKKQVLRYFSMYNENALVSHLPRVDGVQNSPNNFDLNPVTLTYDLDLWPWWPWPWPLRPWPWTIFSETRLKTGFFIFLTLVTLTFDLWPWPSNLSKIWLSSMRAPNFRSVGPTVQPCRAQTDTHTHTDATENITSSANAGGKKGMAANM